MSPTGCAVFSSVRTANGGPATGICYGSGEMMTADVQCFISAAGLASNFAITYKHNYFALILTIADLLADTRRYDDFAAKGHFDDLTQLWLYSFRMKSEFARYMLLSFLVMKKHRDKVIQTRDSLMERGRITKREAARIFAQWGKPPTWDIYHGLSKAAKDALATVAKGLDGE